jgi:hypothetical protein
MLILHTPLISGDFCTGQTIQKPLNTKAQKQTYITIYMQKWNVYEKKFSSKGSATSFISAVIPFLDFWKQQFTPSENSQCNKL